MPPDYSSPDPDLSQSSTHYPARTDDAPKKSWGQRKRTPCELCGVIIVQRMSGQRRFCSRSCASRGHRGLPPAAKPEGAEDVEIVRVQETTKTRPAKCQECGAEFLARDHAPQRFCSGGCASTFTSRERAHRGGFLPTKPVRGVELPCLTCGKPVYRTQGALIHRGQYCSRACHHSGLRVSAVTKVCPHCRKNFTVPPSKSEQTHCSHRCQKSTRIARPLDRMHNGRPARLDHAGYVMVWEPSHPRAFHGWYTEHRLVMEASIGRHLERREVVHHISGDKQDNRIENLSLMNEYRHNALTGRELSARRKAEREELAALRAFKAAHDAANNGAPAANTSQEVSS